jgi:hypothetical protein
MRLIGPLHVGICLYVLAICSICLHVIARGETRLEIETETFGLVSRKHVKRVVKETKSRWIQTKLDEIENRKDQLRNHWRNARNIVDGYTGDHRKPRVIKMRKPDGLLARNQEESAKVFEDHFEKKVFNRNEVSSYDDTIFNKIDSIPCDPNLGEVPTSPEIQKMKTEKAPVKKGLPPEAKLLAGLSQDILEKIIADFWTNPDFNPEIWKHVVL